MDTLVFIHPLNLACVCSKHHTLAYHLSYITGQMKLLDKATSQGQKVPWDSTANCKDHTCHGMLVNFSYGMAWNRGDGPLYPGVQFATKHTTWEFAIIMSSIVAMHAFLCKSHIFLLAVQINKTQLTWIIKCVLTTKRGLFYLMLCLNNPRQVFGHLLNSWIIWTFLVYV